MKLRKIIWILPILCLGIAWANTPAWPESRPPLEVDARVDKPVAVIVDIIDIKPLEQLGINYRLWAFILGLILLISLLIWGWVVYRHKRESRYEEAVIIKRPAHELALEGFYRLQNASCNGPEEIKKFYFELAEIFRFYLERRYGFPASDWTSEEINACLNKNSGLSFELKGQSKLFLSNTDLVKFAEHVPEEVQIRAEVQRAIQFVEVTKEVPLEDAKP